MPDVLPNRARPARTYAAVVLFVLVYVGVLAVVFAPKDVIPIETGAIFATN
jgi:hypothetical protein